MAHQHIAICVFSILSIVGCIGSPSDVSFHKELIKRINALEKQGRQQAEKIFYLESSLEKQDQRLVILEKSISDYKQRLGEQDNKIAVQKKAINDYKQRLGEHDNKIAVQERAISDLKQKLGEQDNTIGVQEMAISDIKQRLEEQDHKLFVQDRTIADLEQTLAEMKLKQNPEVGENLVTMVADNYQIPGQYQAEKMLAMEARLAEQDKKLVAQEKTISDNKQRLEEQDNRLAVQERAIHDNKPRIEEQDSQLAEKENRIREYQQRVTDLEHTVAEMKLRYSPDAAEQTVNSDDEGHQSKGIIRSNKADHSGYKTVSRRQRRALLDAESPVAFHAVMRASVTHLGLKQKIVFPGVKINLGAGYHDQHGLFIAPQPGIYIFSTSIMAATGDHNRIGVNLVKNGQVLASAGAYGYSDHDQGSVTVVTQLAAGDEVWVSLDGPADTSLYGRAYDSFMGCLVVPL